MLLLPTYMTVLLRHIATDYGPWPLIKGQDTIWARKSFYQIYENRSHYVLSPYHATAHIQRRATSPSVDLMTRASSTTG